ncbi:four-carbon acid sugar kinase family protein [Sutcliffiella deserti]|uniref:four-carbon acid sugar kinase family protein n=1 Tax=Sutcliffiella deserti TaxID=2875501 RepID=UPI001CBAB2C6|nr:four-carbon acid sugar kinase family protein [Sutcliffiella deserti]
MKVGIIADDLTGATDTGVQFARNGLNTSVLMSKNEALATDLEVLVIDTDSRAIPEEEAYRRVKETCSFLKTLNSNIIYKKIDSTMRGNIAAELEAVYNSLSPDFVIVAPGYPKNNRIVENGIVSIHGRPVHETEFANDPTTPVENSNFVEMLRKGTRHKVGLITSHDLKQGAGFVLEKMKAFHSQNTAYLVFDTTTEEELQKIVHYVKTSKYQVVWCGSAGLANYLLEGRDFNTEAKKIMPKNDSPVLMVIGSVNKNSRKQLEHVLADEHVKGIILQSHLVLGDKEVVQKEISRVLREVDGAVDQSRHIVLYSAGSPEEVNLAKKIGEGYGLSPKMVSERISEVLGNITSEIIKKHTVDRLFLTGGDTAKKVCNSLRIGEFKLIDEVETGIPIGTLVYKTGVLTITKAGGFGTEYTLVQSLNILRGDKITCAQSLV